MDCDLDWFLERAWLDLGLLELDRPGWDLPGWSRPAWRGLADAADAEARSGVDGAE